MTVEEVAGVNFRKLFASIDAMDTESFLGFIHDDCIFRFGSSPPVKGRDGIQASVNDFFSMFAALRHDLKRIVAGDEAIACEGEVTYTRHDGRVVTLPFCNIFETDSGLITIYRIYIDIGPLFAE
jgi:ketosteroid isomerase-like protein